MFKNLIIASIFLAMPVGACAAECALSRRSCDVVSQEMKKMEESVEKSLSALPKASPMARVLQSYEKKVLYMKTHAIHHTVLIEILRILSCDVEGDQLSMGTIAKISPICAWKKRPDYPVSRINLPAKITGDLCPDLIPAGFDHDALCQSVPESGVEGRALSRTASEVTVTVMGKQYIVEQSRVLLICNGVRMSVMTFGSDSLPPGVKPCW